MSNPLSKIALLCACTLIVGPAAVQAQHGTTSYKPPPKIETTPASPPISGTISVTASIFNKPGGEHAGLHLRVVAADHDGNWPPNPNIGDPYDAGLGSQNWAHWSSATFDKVTVPSVTGNQTLAMIVNYELGNPKDGWSLQKGRGNEGAVVFKKKCNPATQFCHWVKQ